MKSYKCPHCGMTISEEELVEADDDAEFSDSILSSPPPKHLTVRTEIDGVTPVTTIRYRRLNPVILFFLPFTCLWAGGSMAGLYGTQIVRHEFNLQQSLFGIPFLIGSIVLVSACLFMLFGKYVVTLSAGKGSVFAGVGPFGWTRRFAYGYNTTVNLESWTRRGGNGLHEQRAIAVADEQTRKTFRFGTTFGEEALRYIAAVLRRECRRA